MTALNILFYIVMVAIVYSIILAYQYCVRVKLNAKHELMELLNHSDQVTENTLVRQMIKQRSSALFYDIDMDEDEWMQHTTVPLKSISFADVDEEAEGISLIGGGKPRRYSQEAPKSLFDYREEQKHMTA